MMEQSHGRSKSCYYCLTSGGVKFASINFISSRSAIVFLGIKGAEGGGQAKSSTLCTVHSLAVLSCFLMQAETIYAGFNDNDGVTAGIIFYLLYNMANL